MASPARSAQSPTVAKEVEAAENTRLAAMEQGDIATVETFIADDFLNTTGQGRVVDRAAYLNGLRTRTGPRPHLVHEDVLVRVYGETAIVTGQSRTMLNGEERPGKVRYTHVYVKRRAGWQMVAMHVSSIQ
jgi:ketosteroid isomerase-like protein